MSSTVDLDALNIREQLVRIDRSMAETQKFQAEIEKMHVEVRKMHRDRFLAPFVVVAATIAGLGTTVGPVLVKAIFPGGHP